MDEEIYYYYKYKLGNDNVEVAELDLYENEELDIVNVCSDYSFWMISKDKNKLNDFCNQIANILENDCYAAARLHYLANENREKFSKFRKNIK